MENKKKYNELLKQAEEKQRQRQERIKDYWNNLHHFNTPDDVPHIPIVPKEEYENFYLPRLLKAGAIPKKDLIDGQIYIGEHRNCTIARWNKKENQFEYWRHKFGAKFIDTCNHFEDDNGFALFVPIKLGKEEDFK